jgi:hypothetical protein
MDALVCLALGGQLEKVRVPILSGLHCGTKEWDNALARVTWANDAAFPLVTEKETES